MKRKKISLQELIELFLYELRETHDLKVNLVEFKPKKSPYPIRGLTRNFDPSSKNKRKSKFIYDVLLTR